MNKVRRNALNEILGMIEDIRENLEGIHDEEEECRDNVPENLWGSERYEMMEEAISNMEDALGNLADACDSLEEIVNG